ncbi:hypothetical protein I7I50_11831 [Histoplasma capsulatum G186AR]|uniref:Secreted protein n=1 Tax=Ajellomyces capsulatus TaxID=5037 RepID=A0A8H7ZBE7_AJECA|nr:hypothetical protein I7I52_03069 [Histoplasma capsulatum]QSS70261.1 hypothetical protein I7I50_11831 [Histoplasma capsulatum G186AR]
MFLPFPIFYDILILLSPPFLFSLRAIFASAEGEEAASYPKVTRKYASPRDTKQDQCVGGGAGVCVLDLSELSYPMPFVTIAMHNNPGPFKPLATNHFSNCAWENL